MCQACEVRHTTAANTGEPHPTSPSRPSQGRAPPPPGSPPPRVPPSGPALPCSRPELSSPLPGTTVFLPVTRLLFLQYFREKSEPSHLFMQERMDLYQVWYFLVVFKQHVSPVKLGLCLIQISVFSFSVGDCELPCSHRSAL